MLHVNLVGLVARASQRLAGAFGARAPAVDVYVKRLRLDVVVLFGGVHTAIQTFLDAIGIIEFMIFLQHLWVPALRKVIPVGAIALPNQLVLDDVNRRHRWLGTIFVHNAVRFIVFCPSQRSAFALGARTRFVGSHVESLRFHLGSLFF